MTIKRGYLPVGSCVEYDKYCDRKLLESRILNESVRNKDMKSAFLDFKSQEKLEVMKKEVQETFDNVSEQLQSNKEKTARYNQSKISSGRQNPDLIIETPEAKTERLKLEVKIFICEKETEKLDKLLLVASEKKVKIDLSLMLKRGCQGSSCRPYGVIHVDGQPVKMNKEVLVINCTDSPYHGVAMHQYISAIVRPWKKAQAKLNDGKLDVRRRMEPKGFSDAEIVIECGIARKNMIKENNWQDLFAIKLQDKPNIPKIPEGVEIHELVDKVVEVEVKDEKSSVPKTSQKTN